MTCFFLELFTLQSGHYKSVFKCGLIADSLPSHGLQASSDQFMESIHISSLLQLAHGRLVCRYNSDREFLRLDSLLSLLRRSLQLGLELFTLALDLPLSRLQTLVVHVDPADLCGSDNKDERVHSSKGNVLGPDDEAPAGPDGTRAHKRKVLGEGEGLCGAREVGCAGEDHAPFHDWCPAELLERCFANCHVVHARAIHCACGRIGIGSDVVQGIPEMNSLGANGAVPEAGEASRASSGGRSSTGICLSLSEEGPEAAEDTGARTERHDGSDFPLFSRSARERRWMERRLGVVVKARESCEQRKCRFAIPVPKLKESGIMMGFLRLAWRLGPMRHGAT
jgi:hypothetical protein